MENRKETLARVLRFAKPYRWYLLAALVSAVLSVSLTLYAPVLIGRGIDQIIAPGKVYFDNLLPILIELGIVAVLAAIFQWLLTLCTNIVTYKTVRDLRSAAFEHMEELPLSNIDSRPHGDIISRIINDIDSVSDGLLQGFSQLSGGDGHIFHHSKHIGKLQADKFNIFFLRHLKDRFLRILCHIDSLLYQRRF